MPVPSLTVANSYREIAFELAAAVGLPDPCKIPVMTTRWEEAQKAEREYWRGPDVPGLVTNAMQSACKVREWIPLDGMRAALEVGIGGLGVGPISFLPVGGRVAIDPLPLLPCDDDIRRLRVPFTLSRAENIPFPDESFDLVLCCNALDHVEDPSTVLKEVHRVLRPKGHFFLFVDVFSLLGILKWYAWTRRRHKNEILVRAHPHRFLRETLWDMMTDAGMQIVREDAVSIGSRWWGHSRRYAMLGKRVDEPL